MTSSDSYVVIDGHVYRLEGSVPEGLSDAEFKREVLTRLDSMEAEQKAIRAEVGQLATGQEMLRHDMANLQTSVYWVFAGIGIFIGALAIPAFWLAVMSFFKDRDTKPKTDTAEFESAVRRIVRDMQPGLNS